MERDRVFILINTYRYGPGVTGEEANLYYVAITRSKSELYFVRSPSKYTKFDNKKKVEGDSKTDKIRNACSTDSCHGCDECCDNDHHFIDHYYSESGFA